MRFGLPLSSQTFDLVVDLRHADPPARTERRHAPQGRSEVAKVAAPERRRGPREGQVARAEARRRFTVADHVAATAGIECRKDQDVIDETPMAYKSIDSVMEAQRDLVEIVHTLHQVVCVKG